jgi:GT2 family glycosyltransferase
MVEDVSVVIPAYNAAAFLAETLATVTAQSVPPAEIIVVDDGSTDDTAGIARRAGARVVRTPNRGPPGARNAGIAAARGRWIALLDADDLWHPRKLALQLDALALAPDVVAVSCDHYQFDDTGTLMPSALAARRERYLSLRRQPLASGRVRIEGLGTDLMKVGMLFFPSTLLLRREAVAAVGGFDEALRWAEDLEFLLRLLAHGDLLFVEAPPLMGYRVHAGGVSRDHGAMSRGLIGVGERLARDPARYAPGAAAAFAPRLREARRVAAAAALRDGDPRLARALLGSADRAQDRFWWQLKAASLLPPALLAFVLTARRGWLGHDRPAPKLP